MSTLTAVKRHSASVLHLVAFGFAAVTVAVVPSITHDAPLGGYVGGRAAEQAPNVASWQPEHAERFPGCEKAREHYDDVPSRLVVMHQDSSVREMPFDMAWDINHDATEANNVWVIGACS